VLQILVDGNPLRIALANCAVESLRQRPPLGQISPVAGPDVERHVVPQTVTVVLLEPHHRVVENIPPNFLPAVIGTRVAPGCAAAIVVVEVDPSLVPFSPPVEPPQIQIARPEMVIDDV